MNQTTSYLHPPSLTSGPMFGDPYTTCPLCGSGRIAPRLQRRYHGIDIAWSDCGDCSLFFQNPRLSGAAIRRLYATTGYFAAAYGDYFKNDPIRIANGRRRLDLIQRVTGVAGGRLLDIGSAT